MKSVFKNAKIHGRLTDITVEDGVLTSPEPSVLPGYDIGGKTVIPGLVDIHIHGCGGFDSTDGQTADIAPILAAHGTTSFLPTIMTAPSEKIKKLTSEIPESKGAKILGYHLEGPYLSLKYAGAQNEKYMKLPDIDSFNKFKNTKIVTLAPELPGALDFIKECKAHMSLGHSGSDYETAVKAFESGADCLTHMFNAMKPIHHRAPGMVPAAADCGAYVQVICDGIHIHPSVIRMLYKLFGADKMILISDSMPAAGLPDGEYTLGGDRVIVKAGVARTPNGALAGSTSFLLDCVKHAVDFGIPFDDAVKMATSTPAGYLNEKLGKLEVGYPADFLVLNGSLDLETTVINGEIQ